MQPNAVTPAWTRQQVLMAVSFFGGWIGLDRFYQQQVLWGVLKLITIGGFGIWWIIDAVYYTSQAGKA